MTLHDDGLYSYPEDKVCSSCRIAKPYSCFSAQTKSRDGLQDTCKDCHKITSRRWYRKNAYGMTDADYEAMLATQNGVCAICGTHPEKSAHFEGLCIDHCHATGRVRGLLCDPCNKGLGCFRDNRKHLAGAIDYLAKFEGK